MFHKEGTATGSSPSGGGGSDGGKKQPPHRGGGTRGPGGGGGKGGGGRGGGGGGGGVLDVPMRKSDRRKLRDRFVELYLPHLLVSEEAGGDGGGAGTNGGGEGDAPPAEADTAPDRPQHERRLRRTLDAIFADPAAEVAARRLRPADATGLLGGRSGEARVTAYLRSAGASLPSGGNRRGGADADGGDEAFWPYAVPVPVAFEVEHSDTREVSLVPSVATLSVLPDLLPPIVVSSYTSRYLCRGANLMRGGMTPQDLANAIRDMKEREEARRGVGAGGRKSKKKGNDKRPGGRQRGAVPAEEAVVAVRASSNPQPFAVGLVHPDLLNSSSGGDAQVGEGCRGIGINVLSCFGDDWTREMVREVAELGAAAGEASAVPSPFGGTFSDGSFGNVGFVVDGKDRFVLGLTSAGNADNADADADEDGSDEEEDRSEGDPSGEGKGDGEVSEAAQGISAMEVEGEETGEKAANDEEASSSEDGDKDDPVEIQSDLLLASFQRACVSLQPSSLPMPVSVFYANHVLKSRPEGMTLDIKATRWKKFGPFLNEQASLGVVAVKDNQTLTAVDRGHISLKEARKQRKKEREASDGDASGKTKTAVVTLNIIPPRISSTLSLPSDLVAAAEAKTEERRGTGFLTKPEVRACLEWYITEQGLDDGAGDEIQLDGNLCDILYGRSKKERAADASKSDFPTRCSRKDAHEKFLEKLDKAYALVEMPGSRITKLERGTPPTVDIEVSTVRGRNKCVTYVRHLEDYGINATAFANDVSKRFATSATVEEDPTQNSRAALKKKGYVEISFQGHLAEELRMLLTGGAEGRSGHGGAKGGEYKLPKGCIDVKLKKGVPSRRKG